jgi:hypothetical protein
VYHHRSVSCPELAAKELCGAPMPHPVRRVLRACRTSKMPRIFHAGAAPFQKTACRCPFHIGAVAGGAARAIPRRTATQRSVVEASFPAQAHLHVVRPRPMSCTMKEVGRAEPSPGCGSSPPQRGNRVEALWNERAPHAGRALVVLSSLPRSDDGVVGGGSVARRRPRRIASDAAVEQALVSSNGTPTRVCQLGQQSARAFSLGADGVEKRDTASDRGSSHRAMTSARFER